MADPQFQFTTSTTTTVGTVDLNALADALWPLLEARLMASFPGQKGTGSPLPNSPLNLAVTGVTLTSVSLSWSAPLGGSATYNLYRNGTQVQTGIVGTTATDSGLTAGTSYTYYVTSQSALGEGSRSNQVTGTTGALPNAPTSLAVTSVTTSSVSLSWAAPAGGATSYNLYRNGTKVQTGIAGLSTTDTGLSPATSYNYTVTGSNTFGEGPQSNQVTGTTSSVSPSIKWNPGHYTESDTVIGTGGGLSTIQSEIDAMAAQPNIKGCMILVYWGFLQQAANTYTFTNLDTIVAYIKGKGKRWALQVVAGIFNYGTNPPTSASNSPVPAYINNGDTTTWGQAGTRANGITTILSGQSGWWGGDGNGHTYGAALWRPNVMTEWIKLHQALGARYDSDPACELIYQGEDSFYQGTGSTNNSDYNDTTQLQNWKNYLRAQDIAWPTTNYGFSETFLQFQNNSINLTNYITDTGKPWVNKPPLMGQTDALGAVQRSAIHTWGSQTFAGQLGALGDRRPTNRFISEIQAPDMGFFQNLGSPREDVKAGLDIMKCTHTFWAIVPSPIAVTTKPAKYPVTFTANPTGTSATLASPWPLPTGQYDFVTSAGGRMNATKGSTAVTFTVSQASSTNVVNINFPLIPYNWSNGGTASAAQNGTSASYTDAGLLAWINDPANALLNTAYPTDYP